MNWQCNVVIAYLLNEETYPGVAEDVQNLLMLGKSPVASRTGHVQTTVEMVEGNLRKIVFFTSAVISCQTYPVRHQGQD